MVAVQHVLHLAEQLRHQLACTIQCGRPLLCRTARSQHPDGNAKTHAMMEHSIHSSLLTAFAEILAEQAVCVDLYQHGRLIPNRCSATQVVGSRRIWHAGPCIFATCSSSAGLPVIHRYGQLLGKRLNEAGFTCARRAMQQHLCSLAASFRKTLLPACFVRTQVQRPGGRTQQRTTRFQLMMLRSTCMQCVGSCQQVLEDSKTDHARV